MSLLLGAGFAQRSVACRAALVARKGGVGIHKPEPHAALAAALAADRGRHRVVAESLIIDAELAQRKRVEARGRNSMALSLGRRHAAGPISRRRVSTNYLELARAAVTADSDNRDWQPVNRAVPGDGMRERLPPIEPALRALPSR